MTRNKQIRAVLLAALMVFSVFAGTIALSGSAAAEATSINTTEVTGDTATINVTVDSQLSENNTTVWIDQNGDGILNASEPRATNTTYTPGAGVDVLVEGLDTSSVADGDSFNVSAAETQGGITNGVTSEEVNATVTKTAPASQDEPGNPELVSAVHYTDAGDNDVLELSFSEDVNLSGASFEVYQDDDLVTSTVVASSATEPEPGQVVIPTTDIYTGDIVVNVEGVEDTAGNPVEDGLDSDNNATVTVATVTATGNDVNAYQGEVVAITNGDTGQDVEIESDDSQDDNEGFAFSGSTGDTSEVFTFNTENREIERYNYTVDGTSGQIDVRDLGLDVTLEDLNVTTDDDLEGTVSANAGNRPVDVLLLDDDGDEVDDEDYTPIEGENLNGQGELDFEFDLTDLADGDYTVEVTDTRSGVSIESDTVTVTEAADGRADFANNVVTDQRGDVVAIPLTLSNTDIATVTIGSEDQGYAANVTVEDGNDDGEVILLWDSSESTSTNAGDVFDVEDSDDDILTGSNDDTNVTTATSDLIDAGDYDLEIRTGRTATEDNADNVGTLVLEEGGVETVQTWTAPNSESFGDLDDVNEALENGNLTQDDQIAFGDKVVVQIVAPGLEGSTGAEDDETPNFFGNGYGDSYRLVINQTNPGPNRDPKTLNVSSADVVADGNNDTYFVVINTETIDAQRSDNDEDVWDDANTDIVDTEDDDAYQVEFKMIGEDDVGSATALVDENSSMTAEYAHVEAEHDFDADPVNVTNAEGQTISGTSNVAPGSELTIRLRSDGDTQPRFLKTATVFVSENGTFSADFDFSEQSLGDTFTATVSGGVADEVEVDGNVAEAEETTTEETTTEETTTEETTTEETTTEETTTEETTTEATTEETTTESQTPGFGVVVALVALVAAALLAIRRD